MGRGRHARSPVRGRVRAQESLRLYPRVLRELKEDAQVEIRLDTLSVVAKNAGVPVFAVGGITPENAYLCMEKGAAGVGVISAILSAKDVPGMVEAFRRSLGGL